MMEAIRKGAGISHFMDDLSFYNIIEVEKPKGSETKKDVKQCRFWLKVEYSELKGELRKLIDLQDESTKPKTEDDDDEDDV